jgi:hypothetical protein
MDTNEIKTLCLKHVYGTPLTEAEQALVDDYTQTTDGRDYLRECREMKDLLANVADIKIKPVDDKAMIERFEYTIRQKFKQTVFRPWWEANSPAVILGLLAGFFISMDGWTVINAVLLGSCVLWFICDYFQRYYFAKTLSRPDLYEYAKASRRRSDRILRSGFGWMLVVVCSGLGIAAVSYATYWGYQEYGIIVPVIVIFLLTEAVAIVVYQYRKLKRSNSEVWDWWAEKIKE